MIVVDKDVVTPWEPIKDAISSRAALPARPGMERSCSLAYEGQI